MKFCELPIGARFRWQGKVYTKTALSMAREQETRHGFIFGFTSFDQESESGQHEVEPIEAETQNPS